MRRCPCSVRPGATPSGSSSQCAAFRFGTVPPVELEERALRIVPGGPIRADRVVALPRLAGRGSSGLPQTVDGFVRSIRTWCPGTADVFAAGDITDFPVKQGGLAAQQADAAAELIAADAGVDIAPQPFRPVLRGLLLTGRPPRYLRHELMGGTGDSRGDHRTALVAAGEDRRPLPGTLPRLFRRRREPARGAPPLPAPCRSRSRARPC